MRDQHRPFGTDNGQKMHIAWLGQCPLPKHVAHVAGDHRTFAAKQLRHLGLTEPDAVSLQAHIQRHLAIGVLEQDDLIEGLPAPDGFL